ncbi:hypothetical protein COY93_04555 [Candidatus Uhrbacteria bacterium CG_4_10_14_0_8_um_filter_58_22]|uniref:Uncharacterized protein n=1 Tax=Candidatus Uhrbacteria bacterium CG_4_10_14_0_8_um_filter_58_22 TaxID=1975029 RepID=A0A2M7Q9P7_9BACT|nr:MAG: hypothetical protein AUJ19_01900 [Parcubacteria group bacterium CG1_02_58_44]PIY61906.1 MAG: hypothetical protein COY93_04555 [Candidatus Uhrbacteria bacterium CG_4_10_14_0_8_um_filter_58_22]
MSFSEELAAFHEDHLVEVPDVNGPSSNSFYSVAEARALLLAQEEQRQSGGVSDGPVYVLYDTQPARSICSCSDCRKWQRGQRRDRKAVRSVERSEGQEVRLERRIARDGHAGRRHSHLVERDRAVV